MLWKTSTGDRINKGKIGMLEAEEKMETSSFHDVHYSADSHSGHRARKCWEACSPDQIFTEFLKKTLGAVLGSCLYSGLFLRLL